MTHTTIGKRLLAVLLLCLFLLPVVPANAAQTDGFRIEKTAQLQPDGTVQISLRAFQTGRVAATDVVLVLDVSGSMEHNSVVQPDALESTKTYYMIYEHEVVIDGKRYTKRDYVPVTNTAAPGETPTWYATMPDAASPTQIDPLTTPFYTGAMENLRAATTEFVQSIADNAALYDANHRIAVVEFSSPIRKNDGALCTHDNAAHTPFYANILSGDGTADGALLPVRSHASQLQSVLASLKADGATYSDDAMTQAKRILSASDAANRIVILFTDGGPGSYGWEGDNDNSALPTANGAITAAREMKAQGVQIYTIGVFNEANLSGEIGQKNETYLNLISSNYPQASSMDNAGDRASGAYCSIGETGMNLQSAFSAVSAVLGTPVHGAQVRDTVSDSFWMTTAQKDALRQQYPAVRIADNSDGTTAIELDEVDFPTVAVRADGTPVDPQDSGIFSMTFSVTPRDDLLGGKTLATNTGVCGVFSGGIPFAQFDTPQIFLPVREGLLDSLLSVPQSVSVYAGETLGVSDLFTDLSDSRTASFADSVTYTVTDAQGASFTGGVPASSQTYTVTLHVRIDDTEYTRTADVPVTVRDNPVTALEILSLPTKKTYIEGDTLDTAGLRLQLRRESGKTEPLAVSGVTVTPSVLADVGQQTVTVRYGDLTAQFTVAVEENTPVSLEIVSLPTKTTYIEGDTPDVAGIQLQLRRKNGQTEPLAVSGVTVTPAVLSNPGQQTVTVRYGDLTAQFTVAVEENTPSSLEIVSFPTKTTYYEGDTLDTAGMQLRLQKKNGQTEPLAVSGVTVTPAVLSNPGQQTVTVQYGDLTAQFTVTVTENPVTTLEIVSFPTKTAYYEGDALDTAGLRLRLRRQNGRTEPLAVSGVAIAPAVFTQVGTQTVTVRWENLSASFSVTVQALRAVSARVVETPVHNTYVYRRSPDFTGLAVEITYNNGSKRIVRDLSQMTIRAQSAARVRRGARTFVVTTQGVSASFTMQVKLVWWQWIILILLFGWIWY